jgi:ATP:ADP antiporter, AAA family
MSPLERVLTKLAPIEPGETKLTLAAFSLFFCMWAGYFAVRPVRETIGTVLGRSTTANLWIYTAAISILIIPIYGLIVARLRRQVFLPSIYAFVALVLVAVGVAMQGNNVPPLVGKIFYVFISVVNLFIISVFWSFLLEIFDSGQTKRLFGVIAAGGSAGALTGPFISDLVVGTIGNSGILFLGAGFFAAAIVAQRVLLNIWSAGNLSPEAAKRQDDKPIGGNPFAGVMIILRSPYLLGIALFIMFISTVNTLLYFEQLRFVAITFTDNVERTRVFARLDWIVQTITVLSQIFITGRVTKRFGVIALLTVIPIAMVLGFLSLVSTTTFAMFAAVLVFRRACEYAFIRPGREMLWAPLDKETKYKAKNTVDVPVYRGADALVAQGTDALDKAGVGAAGIAIIGAVVSALWAGLGWWLGKSYEAKSAAKQSTSTSG